MSKIRNLNELYEKAKDELGSNNDQLSSLLSFIVKSIGINGILGEEIAMVISKYYHSCGLIRLEFRSFDSDRFMFME